MLSVGQQCGMAFKKFQCKGKLQAPLSMATNLARMEHGIVLARSHWLAKVLKTNPHVICPWMSGRHCTIDRQDLPVNMVAGSTASGRWTWHAPFPRTTKYDILGSYDILSHYGSFLGDTSREWVNECCCGWWMSFYPSAKPPPSLVSNL